DLVAGHVNNLRIERNHLVANIETVEVQLHPSLANKVAGIFVLRKISTQVTSVRKHEIPAMEIHLAQYRIAYRGGLRGDLSVAGGARDKCAGRDDALASVRKERRRPQERENHERTVFHKQPSMTEASPSASPEFIGAGAPIFNRSSFSRSGPENRPSRVRANRAIDSHTFPVRRQDSTPASLRLLPSGTRQLCWRNRETPRGIHFAQLGFAQIFPRVSSMNPRPPGKFRKGFKLFF